MRDFSKLAAPFEDRRRVLCAVALALLGFFVLFHKLGDAALFEPDEGRNAEVAREILLLQDWVTPHYDFIPYLDKPMPFYWLVAFSYKLFGVSQGSARLPSVLAAVGCLLLVANLARTPAGNGRLWSGLFLLTSPEFFIFARTTIFDMCLTFFITLALWAFYRGERADGKSRRAFFLLMYAAMGGATLIKGPIGAVVPGMIVFFYLLLRGQWSLLSRMEPVRGGALFLLIVVPWYLWAETRNPGYLGYFLLDENLLRYFTPYFKRGQPWYYYFEVVALGFLPWSVYLYAPFQRTERAPGEEKRLFLFLWIIVPFVFFSFSAAKHPGYVLPIFPPLAVLTGEFVARALAAPTAKARWPQTIPWLILLAAYFYFSWMLFHPDRLPFRVSEQSAAALPSIYELSRPFMPVLLALLLSSAAASLWLQPAYYFIICCIFFSTFQLFSHEVLGPISQARSSRQLAEKAAPFLRPGDQIVVYDSYFSTLPFYLRANRPIWIVQSERRRSIMGSFYMAAKNPRVSRGSRQPVLNFEEFSREWKESPARLVVFVEEKNFDRLSRELDGAPKRISTVGDVALVANQ